MADIPRSDMPSLRPFSQSAIQNPQSIRSGPGSGGLDQVDGVAFSPSGHLLVSSHRTDSILRYEGDTGDFVDVFVGSASGGIDGPGPMTVRRDGNVYVIQVDGMLRRVTPDGDVEVVANVSFPGVFTSAVRFGSGLGGWERDHIYIMDRSGGVHDVRVGIDGGDEPHL